MMKAKDSLIQVITYILSNIRSIVN